MEVTFIHHSSFFVNLKNCCLLFDYFKGSLPTPLDIPLFIFASHGHGDHFNTSIFDYARKWEKVHIVLSNDIDHAQIPKDLLSKVTVVSPNNDYSISAYGVDIAFSTLLSTDKGVAFLIKALDKTIYYAGDLHLWLWREDVQEDKDMQSAFEKEIEKLRGVNIDLAFIPLDPRQENDAFLGLDYITRIADIKRIYPMHCWNDFSIIDKLLKDECSINYRDKICKIRKDGFTNEI